MSDLPLHKYRIEPLLQKRKAVCLRCDRPFSTEINPEVRGDFGALLRGERQVFRLCPGCRSGESFDVERARRRTNAHAES